MKHTTLPWEYFGNAEAWGIRNSITLKPILIAKGDIRTNEANAEFIVRACNCHEELVEAAHHAFGRRIQQKKPGRAKVNFVKTGMI